jgi:hypothetical protein
VFKDVVNDMFYGNAGFRSLSDENSIAGAGNSVFQSVLRANAMVEIKNLYKLR